MMDEGARVELRSRMLKIDELTTRRKRNTSIFAGSDQISLSWSIYLELTGHSLLIH